jgi:hypothetical protein
MLRRILSAMFGAIGFAFNVVRSAGHGLMMALGLAPTVEPAELSEEDLAELSAVADDMERVNDEAMVKLWASATLYGRPFEITEGRRVSGWLLALTSDDAARIAAADGAGVLRAHLDGVSLFPELPPVDGFEETRRWRIDRRPLRVRRQEIKPAIALATPGATDPFELISMLERG